MPSLIFFITCVNFCGQWAVDPSPTNLIHSKAIFLFRSWINGPDGAKKILGAFPFVEIENRPAPLSFVKLSLSAQIYYFCITNLGAVNHSAKLRFVELNRFDRELKDCRSVTEQWLYSLKRVGTLDRIPDELKSEMFERLFRACEIARFDKEQKLKYESDMITERDEKNIINTAIRLGKDQWFAEGKTEGLAEGEARGMTKGRAEERIAIAGTLKQQGIPAATIAAATGMTEDEIESL